jgi:lysophospholipase L1-like esterase
MMRIATIAAAWLAIALSPGIAAENGDPCSVPEYMMKAEGTLPRVATQLKGGSINVLIYGTRSSTLPGPDGKKNAYPARFEALLQERLPKAKITVSTEIVSSGQSAADMAKGLPKLLAERKPNFVIWQTGIFDAMRNIDPDIFRAALDEGIAASHQAGADIMLVNQQYSPRTESMINLATYSDAMRVAAQQNNVPLFDRLAMMKYWSEQGVFDFTVWSDKARVAERVHECFGKLLTEVIVDTAKTTKAGLQGRQ